MSSDSDDLPEELLWKGDLDDEGHDDLELYGGDLDGTLVGRPAHGAVGVLDTSDEEDDGDDEDPLGGIDILGSINLSPDLKRNDVEEAVHEGQDDEDFVKILEDCIERDLPKYVIYLLIFC